MTASRQSALDLAYRTRGRVQTFLERSVSKRLVAWGHLPPVARGSGHWVPSTSKRPSVPIQSDSFCQVKYRLLHLGAVDGFGSRLGPVYFVVRRRPTSASSLSMSFRTFSSAAALRVSKYRVLCIFNKTSWSERLRERYTKKVYGSESLQVFQTQT